METMENKNKNKNKKLRVLVIDDDPFIAESIRDIIEKEFNAKVDTSNNGIEALYLLIQRSNNGEPYMLVLTDNSMPGLTGTKVIDNYKKLYPDTKTKFLLVTGDSSLNNIGIPILYKPFTLETFIEKIEPYINHMPD